MDSVVVVEDGSFVGCVAGTSWGAAKAIEVLAKGATWQRAEHPSSDELFSHLKATAETDDREREPTRSNDRNGEPGDAKNSIRESYTIAYIQHAPMEPRAAVAQWEDGKLTVWTGTQQPMRVRGELMSVFRLSEDRVRVIVPDTGGGFGGKHSGEVAVEAARLAKACGKPVLLRWTREEEFRWAYCRPAGLIEIAATLDDAGQIQSWDFVNYNSGRSAIETPYKIDRAEARFVATDSPLRQGSYRALASTANTFARESMMDELASIAGMDPLEFRLKHLPEGRLRDVLVEAATTFRWRGRYRPAAAGGIGIGLACGTEKGSYVAACVEAEVRSGRIVVRSICQAFECGAIQNPTNLRSQVEGCIVMGLGGALMEEMRFRDGILLTDRFSEYPVPRLKDVPPMDIVLCNRPELSSVGAGETPIIAVAPAIANAVFHATGRRIRSMPLRWT
jgi:isoquinoline 1-oxidoreductase